MRKRKLATSHVGAIWPIGILLGGFWIPILLWIMRAANSGQPLVLYSGPAFRALMLNTIWIATLTSVVSIGVAYPVALLWWISRRKTASLIASIIFLPILVGLLARNYSWIGLLSADSLLASLGLTLIGVESYLYTMYSVILVMTYIFIPVAFFVLINAFASISSYELDAAMTAGATSKEIVVKVVLPHTYRQIGIGVFLIFASALGYFVTPRMLGGGKHDMIGNLIWGYSNLGDFSIASSISLTFLFWFSPFYIGSFIFIIQSRKRVLGR